MKDSGRAGSRCPTERMTPPTGLAARVPLELSEPRASEEGEARGDDSRADSASFAGQGLKGPQSVAGIAK